MKRLALVLAGTAVMGVACGGSAAPLAAPSPVSQETGTPTAVVVSGPATVSASVQLIATARFADDSTRDVTAASVWESSNPALATVSPSGVVTIVGSGDVDVRATYQRVVGSMRLRASAPVSPSTFVLTGIVREAAPFERPLSGVRVQVTAGREFGTYTVTDDQGAFTFPAVSAGRMFLEFTRPGYELSTVDLTISGPARRDVWLYPTPPSDSRGAIAYFACPGSFCDSP